jgi:hypothetical protein
MDVLQLTTALMAEHPMSMVPAFEIEKENLPSENMKKIKYLKFSSCQTNKNINIIILSGSI